MVNQKIIYLLTSFKKYLLNNGFNCPGCNHKFSILIERKYFITCLRKCNKCNLLFRTPTVTSSENNKFYQENYSQGYTTDCPNNDLLKKMIENDFKGTDRDYSRFLEIFKTLKFSDTNDIRLFDYGCSWGYGSYQMKKYFNVSSYEISKPRAKYAKEKLNIDVLDDVSLKNLPISDHRFDVFFMSHVLEHLPNPTETIKFGLSIIKNGGYLISFTPNGSLMNKKVNPKWSQQWGLVHSNFIDEEYYKTIFKNCKYYISSHSTLHNQYNLSSNSPALKPYNLEKINKFFLDDNEQSLIDNVEGNELMIIAKKI